MSHKVKATNVKEDKPINLQIDCFSLSLKKDMTALHKIISYNQMFMKKKLKRVKCGKGLMSLVHQESQE